MLAFCVGRTSDTVERYKSLSFHTKARISDVARESCIEAPRCLSPIRSIFYMSRLQAFVGLMMTLKHFCFLEHPKAGYPTKNRDGARANGGSIPCHLCRQITVRPKVDTITQQATCVAPPTRSLIFLLRLSGTAAVCPTDATYLLVYRLILHQPSCRQSVVATTPYHTGDTLSINQKKHTV